MTLASHLLARALGLPPAVTHDVAVDRNVRVPMSDGVVLLAERYSPRGPERPPLVLMRTPYGRGGLYGLLYGRLLAERGFQVLIQSCRGTFGSGGEFVAQRYERSDGLDTLAWLRQQPWFSGEFATVGASYVGYVQWAIAAEAGPGLRAMMPQITASEFRSLTYAGKSFGLDTSLTWIYLLRHQEESVLSLALSMLRVPRTLGAAFRHLPLRDTDRIVTGRQVPFYQDWLEHNAPADPWWQPIDFTGNVARVTAPVHLLGGWYDIFLPATLADYARLQGAGRQPYLTIGPWAHTDRRLMGVGLREALAWFRAHLLGDRSLLRPAPVRIFVMGAEEWRDLPSWPPAGYRTQRWHLQPDCGLAIHAPTASAPDRYRYDPADPTPAVGGTSLSGNSGPRDNRRLEARPDVLVYSSAPLAEDVEAIGPVRAELYVRSSLGHTDFFARLCDVHPDGRSVNVCDGLLRLSPGDPEEQPDGTRRIGIELWPTAHRFLRGHRIRLQVASGAHPRFARNPGSGEPLATATTLVAAEQQVYHDPDHPSALILPVR